MYASIDEVSDLVKSKLVKYKEVRDERERT